MGTTRKFLRNLDKVSMSNIGKATKLQKAVSAVTALGFVLQPMAAMASVITRADGTTSKIETNGNLTKIFADKMINDKIAMSHFKDFKLDAGQIANMYFGQDEKGAADHLVNFVNTRIDINGTVNAIKNQKIGGNLFFLSSQGMVVGAQGVINAGTLYVSTPNVKRYEELVNNFKGTQPITDDAALKDALFYSVPINESGTISVLGKINATDGVNLRAPKIGVGKNVSGDEAVKEFGETSASAAIRTGVVDFADIVNIKDANGNISVNSELQDGALKADKNGNGDIVLSAYNSYNDNYYGLDSDVKDIAGKDVTAELVVAEGATIEAAGKAQLSAEAVNNLQVDDYKLAANNSTAAPAPGEDAGDDGDDEEGASVSNTNTSLVGQIVNTKANVVIDGKVTGEQVDISANAANRYITSESSDLSDITGKLNLVGIHFDAAYGKLTNEAKVDIGEHADIKATGTDKLMLNADGTPVLDEDGNAVRDKALQITANSKLDLEVGASSGGLQLLGGNATAFLPAAGITYAKSANKAEVNINGALASGGSTEIAANADSKIEAKAISTAGKNLPDIALSITDGSNASKVTIGEKAKMAQVGEDGTPALQGDVEIKAKSTNSLTTSASVKEKDETVLATAINITDYDSSADVAINSSVKAGGSLDIAAENTVTDNEVTADNAMGTSALSNKIKETITNITDAADIKKMADEAKEKADKTISAVKESIVNKGFVPNWIKGKLTDTVTDEIAGQQDEATEALWTQISNLFSAGASVGVVNESNKANVTIGQGVELTAADALNIAANSTIEDTHMNVTGGSKNNNKDVNKQALVNASVLYSNIQNDASVTTAGGDKAGADGAATNVKLTGKNVNVTAKAAFKYDRINRMVSDLLDTCTKVAEAYSKKPANAGDTLKDRFEALKNATEAFQTYYRQHEDMSYDDLIATNEFKAMVDAAKNIKTAKTDGAGQVDSSDSLADVVVGPVKVVEAMAEFADVTNYANFSAGSSNEGRDNDDNNNDNNNGSKSGDNSEAAASGGEGAKVSVAGSVTVTNLANNSKVMLGRNTQITADEKVNLSAKSEQTDVSVTGKLAMNGGGDTSVGGSVGVGFTDANSLVVAAQGTEINAGDIAMTADNDIQHVNIAASAGQGGKVGVNGMVSYIKGNSNSVVSVDDEAVLNAVKAAADEAAGKAATTGKISLAANNNTDVIAVSGAIAMGETGGVGASVAITDMDRYNYAAIADNGYSDVARADAKLNKLQQVIEANSGLRQGTDGTKDAEGNDITYTERSDFFGTTTEGESTGSITASALDVSANTSGTIVNVTVAGGVSSSNDTPEKKDDSADKKDDGDKKDENKEESGVMKFIKAALNAVQGDSDKEEEEFNKKIEELINKTEEAKDALPSEDDADKKAAAKPQSEAQSKFTIAGAGSASANLLDGDTAAIIDGAKIKINNTEDATDDNVSVKASDSAVVVAASGAAGISWKTLNKPENAGSTNVAVAGAVGVNKIDSATMAVIRNASIDNADAIINDAQKKGAIVAAGVGMAVANNKSTTNGGSNVAVAANASVNIADNTVTALMENNKVNKGAEVDEDAKTSISNTAFDNDIQVTGGISSSFSMGGEKGTAVGATVAYGSLKNKVQSTVKGGEYDKISTADVTAKTNMTQVGVAANISVAGGGASSTTSVGGTAAYNTLVNDVAATVEGVSFKGESLNVAAYDGAGAADTNAHAESLKQHGFDADGQEYLGGVQQAANENGDSDDKTTDVDITRKGNLIVTGAVNTSVSTGNEGGAAGASISISDIKNNFKAGIKGSDITTTGTQKTDADGNAYTVGTNVAADSNTILAGVAAGAAGSNGSFGIGGSASWQQLHNDVTASIENSKIKAPVTAVSAVSGAMEVNVAGQLGVTNGANSKVGAGLAVAYNSLNNTTGAYVKGSEISAVNAEDAAELTVDAANKGRVYSVGAAVTAGTSNAAVNGVVVVNQGSNNVEAVIDKYNGEDEKATEDGRTKLNNMSKVNVKSSDDSSQLAVIGNVSVAAGSSSKAAVGGSVAINDIGSLGSKQSNKAAINNTDITTTADGKVSAKAIDSSKLTTIAASVAATTGKAAFSGSGAAALIDKETATEMQNTTVNAGAEDEAKGDVEAKASSASKITTVGIIAAGAKNAAVGLGIAVNKINADTKTTLANGSYKVDDLLASSTSTADLKSIGISAAGAQNAGIAGNVGVNLIGSNTQTLIDGAQITAKNNIAALATSKETLKNYAGSVGVAIGGQAGVGLSVAYNEITGKTASVVNNAALNAAGAGDALGEATSKEHKDSKGIIVAADAEHDLDNLIVTVGAAGSGGVSVGAAGTVAVNKLAGTTEAQVNKTTANTNGAAGDVSVLATDKTDVDSTVGSGAAGIGGNVGVAIGAASDTNLLSRNVTAQIDGDDGKQKAFNADKLKVNAQSTNSTKTTAVGAAVAVGGNLAASVAGTVSVTKSDANTLARVNNIVGDNNGLTVNAKRTNNIELVGSGVAVAAGAVAGAGGISVGVLSEDSHTEAQLTKSTITHKNTENAADSVHAENNTTVTTGIAAAAAAIGAGGAAAGAVGVNNFNNTVKTTVANSSITDANTIDVAGKNTLNTTFKNVSVAGGLVGGSLGVGVNTIDTSVVTQVSGSTLKAQDVNVTADETRDIHQTAVNAAVGAVALGANVLVTNIGSAVQGTYKTENNDSIDLDGTDGNKHYAMSDADKSVTQQNSSNAEVYGKFVGKYKNDNNGSGAAKAVDKVGRGGNTEAKGVQVIVDNSSDISATNAAKVTANTTTNTELTAGGASVGLAAASGTFSVLNVKRNSGVTVRDSQIAARDIAIASNQAGNANMNIYQGTAGIAGLNIAVGVAKLTGENKVELDNATLTAGNMIDVTADDGSNVNVDAVGITIGGATFGSITAIAENKSTNDIVVKGSELSVADGEPASAKAADSTTSDDDSSVTDTDTVIKDHTINITANKHNSVTAHARGGNAGMVTGSVIYAAATDNGTSNITLGDANNTDLKNTFSGWKLNVDAMASPAVKAQADSAAVSLAVGGSAAMAKATANGGANLTVNDGEELLVDEANLNADIYAQEGKKSAEAKAEGNSGSGVASIGANIATAITETTANVNVGSVKGKTKEVLLAKKTTYDENGDEIVEKVTKTVGTTAVNIASSNSTSASADARGVIIGGLFSSGTNIATTKNTSHTSASMDVGTDEEVLLGSLNIKASGAGDNLVTADGSGGGLVSADVSGYAASVKNEMSGTTTTTVKGKLNVNGEVDINALQNDRANLNADATKAALVGLSATKADNTISGTTKVDLNNLTLTGADVMNVSADNKVTMGDIYEYAVEGSGYGGFTSQGAIFNNNIHKQATINIGNAKLTTAGSQTYEAKTTGNIDAGGEITAAGLGALTDIDLDSNVQADDSITVGDGAKLKTTKANADITLAAVDNMDVYLHGVANTEIGAVGGASSNVKNILTRNNSISVAGTAELYSMNDINLYAGRNANGSDSKLTLTGESEAYNKTLIGIGKPKLNDQVYQNNNVTMNTGSQISSVRHINLFADAGHEVIRDTSIVYNWHSSGMDENYSSSNMGDTEPDNKHSNNYIMANGTMKAGIQNKQHVTIGDGGTLVFLDKDTLEAVNNVDGNNAIGLDGIKAKLDVSSGINKDDIMIGTMDYGSTLFDRYNQVCQSMNDYSEKPNSTAYLGLKAERDRIFNEMKDMGLLEQVYDDNGNAVYENGNPVYAANTGMTIDYISLPDIVASGGNINIETDTLAGSGSMEAKGGPEVVITNNTNLYMKINDITVGDAGGEINYNGIALTKDKAKDQIIEENKKDWSVGFSNISLDADNKNNNGRILIEGNYGGDSIQAKATVEGQEHLFETTPKADIEINGYVYAKAGDVTIRSAHDSILIQGKDVNSSAGVSGSNVVMEATDGSVSQGYTDGITNIGGSVQNQYSDLYNKFKDEFDDYYKTTVKYDYQKDVTGAVKTAGKKADLKGNMIAGENIYINAADINVNGLIQSGYADYEAIINDDATLRSNIAKIKRNYKGGTLSDAVVTTGTKYRVVVGKNVWDEATGSYKRQLDVYYNPSTGKLVIPSVDAKGGKIYLTGRVSSTGGGSIKALDGAYDINIKNNTNTELQVGRLVSNKTDGLISITDSGRGKVTEYTRAGAKEYDIDPKNDLNRPNGKTVDPNVYKPQGGLRYNWTTGQSVSVTKYFEKETKKGFWGLVKLASTSEMKDWEKDIQATGGDDPTSNAKLNGEYIGTNSNAGNSDFAVIYDNKFLSSETILGKTKSWKSGFLGYYKHTRYNWKTITGTAQQYVASVKADRDIDIGFIGKTEGNVNVNSNGSLSISGKLGTTDNGRINLVSNNGSITQTGVNMVSDNINLSAKSGINGIGITSVTDNVKLSASNEKSGNIDITVAGSYGKAGNVLVGSIINKGTGKVSLTASGDINQANKDATTAVIQGNRIDLVSNNGGIGNNEGGLLVKAGTNVVNPLDSLSASLNATAKKDINLTQTEGDMRVGQIKSTQGDVTITVADGNVIDALPEGEVIDRGDTDALIQKWKDLGLIAGEGSYTAKQQQDVANYQESVKSDYNQYKELDKYYEQNPLSDADKTAYDKYVTAKKAYDGYTEGFKQYQNDSIYYKDESNKPQRANFANDAAYNDALTRYNDNKAAFEKNAGEYSKYANADAYAEAKMGDSWNDYNAPNKSTFSSYQTYTELKQEYGDYASADAYLASDKAQNHMNDLQKSSAEWTENELLYAIQDSIINPRPDSGDTVVKNPNLVGSNITITANNVGEDSENRKVIELAGISNRVDDLKELVNASASTVKWGVEVDGKKVAIIEPKNPLGVQLTDKNGKLTVRANKNVYISNRKEDTANDENPLNIGTITTGGSVRLQGNAGIYNFHDDATTAAAISGKDLLIQGGKGGVGTADRLMTINIKEGVQATGVKGVYLEQIDAANAMQLISVASGSDIVLKAAGDIVSMDTAGTEAQGYINTESKTGTITIEAGGNAGTNDHKLRIKNAEDDAEEQVISVTADGDVYLQGISNASSAAQPAEGTMFIHDITANGLVDVASNGNLNVKSDVTNTANGNITMKAEKSITVNGTMSNTDADGSFTDKGNLILSARNNVKLDKDAVLKAKMVNLVASAVRNEGEQAAAGSISQDANGQIVSDKVIAAAMNGIDIGSAKNTLKTVDLANMDKGDIKLGNDGTYNLDVIIGHKNDGTIDIHNYDKGDGNVSRMKMRAKTEATEVVYLTNDNGGITLPDEDKVYSEAAGAWIDNNFGSESSLMIVKSNNGDVINTKDIHAIDKDVNITATGGNVINKATIDAKTNVSITTDIGDVLNYGNVTGKTVTLKTDDGNIHSTGSLESLVGDVVAETGSGNVLLEKTVTSAENVLVRTANGSITTKADVTAKNNILYDAKGADGVEGNITAEGSIKSDIGNIDMITEAEEGNIYVNGSVTANEGNINMKAAADKGDITVKGNVATGAGDINLTTDAANGNIAVNGNVTTDDGDILLSTDGEIGTIVVNGKVTTKAGNIDLTSDAEVGDITVNGDIKTKLGDIGVTAKRNGNLQFNSDVGTDMGNMDILVEGNGNVNDNDNLFTAIGNAGDKKTGNITLQVKGTGDVDLNEIFATNDASIDEADGSLTLAKIDGNIVAINLRKEGKLMSVKDTVAGPNIIVKGSNMDLENITQRKGIDAILTITPDGSSADRSIDDIHIGEITSNQGVLFDRLWTNTGEIHVSEGKVHIDKLVVNNNAHISNNHMTTGIWGAPPKTYDCDSVYWNNTAINKPGENLGGWQDKGANAERWMFLYLTETPNIQESNGALLSLRNYDYVYNQNFTAVDELNRVHADDKLKYYDISTDPQVVMYFRYDLYDLDEQPQGAAADKVVVEA